LAQLWTAVAAFAGTATAIAVSSEAWAEVRLLWITAGGFLYLAASTILPEVLQAGEDGKSSIRMAQLAAFCSGIFFLYVVALMEEADEGGDHNHHHHHGHEDAVVTEPAIQHAEL
jgi:zinc transporter ZupT